MATRLELDALLRATLNSSNVYFQPPPSVRMKYPAIVYNRNGIPAEHADNMVYKTENQYQIIAIDPDPDSELPDKIKWLPRTRFANFYTSDNLNHWAFTITF